MATSMRTLRATRVTELPSNVDGWGVLTTTAGPRHDALILLGADPTMNSGSQKSAETSVARQAAPSAGRYQIRHALEAHLDTAEFTTDQEAFRYIQPLGNGAWILARAWPERHWNAELGDWHEADNAYIYTRDGDLIRSLFIGGGISALQATRSGEIWVGFSDEGVYRGPGPGYQGLICYDELGAVLFQYRDAAVPLGLPQIDDCYALNVGDAGDVWISYYRGFPLVLIRHRQIERYWSNFPVPFVSSLAVAGDWLLATRSKSLSGTTRTLLLVSLSDMSLEEVSVVEESGQSLDYIRAFGRADRLYLQTGSELFYISALDV